jgi:MoxR-like ATPase
MVLATQNPIEYEGTFPLPEAQLDRFLLRIHLGYPAQVEEVNVLQRQMLRHPIDDLGAVTSASELQQLQLAVRSIHVDPQLQRYIVHIVSLTREHPDVYLGASPRGSLALMRAAQARSMLLGRDYVIPDDVKVLAISALAHRLIMSPEARMRNATAGAVIASVLQEVPVPGSRVPA